jgi:GH24 family phage-related lysozyme (muramidase)
MVPRDPSQGQGSTYEGRPGGGSPSGDGGSPPRGQSRGEVNLGNIDLTAGWIDIAVAFISKKEGFTKTAKWDVNKFRLGYGTDKIFVDGKIRETRQTAPFESTTKEAASQVLKFEVATTYKNRVIGTGPNKISQAQWDALSDPARAALISFVYNVGSLYKVIVAAIKEGNLTLASQRISEGPITGGGKVYPGLVKRRKEEALLFSSKTA